MVTIAPGNSGQPGSPSTQTCTSSGRNEFFALPFTRAAVDAKTRHRLTLVPTQ